MSGSEPARNSGNDSSSTGQDAGRFRVLLVSALPPPPGGIQSWTEVLCERGLPAPFELEIVDTRVTRRHQDIPPKLSPSEVSRFLKILWRIHRSLRSGRFSAMHLNCSLTVTATPRNLASALIARLAGVPYVVHLHGTFRVPAGTGLTSLFYRWAYRTMFDDAASILALGQPSYRSILELGDFAGKTVPLLPNFVNFRAVPGRAPGTKQQADVKVIFTGALVESKGVYTIVRTAELVRGARFQLVGDGPPESRAALIRHIRDRGLHDRVQVMGPVTNRAVLRMLCDNDVFLFPSKFEGFPNSVSEAMAVGLPVVASPVGAIPEMIDVPQGGYLIESNDPAGYVDALSRLRDDPSMMERMGQYNRCKALREYDYDVVIRNICDIYSRIATPRPRSKAKTLP